MMKASFADLKENSIKKSQRQEKIRKKFDFRKKTNKAFSKLKSGEKNKMLICAIYKGFENFKRENLFFQGL